MFQPIYIKRIRQSDPPVLPVWSLSARRRVHTFRHFPLSPLPESLGFPGFFGISVFLFPLGIWGFKIFTNNFTCQ